jgi:hypothetical protein
MITSELLSYIRKQIKNNISNDIIVSKLTAAGWHREDIDEGFFDVNLELKPEFYLSDGVKETTNIDEVKNNKKTLDQYREPLIDDGNVDIYKPTITPKLEEKKQEIPKLEVFNITAPDVEITKTEIAREEIPIIKTPKIEVPILEKPKLEIPIIETPKVENIIINKENIIEPVSISLPEEKYDIEIPAIEIPVLEKQKIDIPVMETPVGEFSQQEASQINNYDIEIPAIEDEVAEEPKIEIPKIELPQILPTVPILPIELYKEEISAPENIKIEIPEIKTETIISPILEIPKKDNKTEESYKIWTPMRVPIKDNSKTESVILDTEKESNEIVIQNQELPVVSEIKPEDVPPIKNIEVPKPVDIVNNEELIPSLISKGVDGSFIPNNVVNFPKEETPPVFSETSKNYLFNNLPKAAMLSSYENDFSSANKEVPEPVKKKSFKIIKWLILFFTLLIIGGVTWAFISGLINIDNIPFIKKDPKILLLNNSKVLSSLKSYKTETSIEISSPSFANITAGIISGEVIPSLDKDSISINTSGSINQDEKGLLSSDYLTIKSTLLKDDITADVKNNNNLDLFITVSDLSQIIMESGKDPLTVKINQDQFNLVPALFPPEVETELKKINLYNVISNGMLSYINNDTLNVYDEFINNVNITEKGQENIKGIDTYHYSINTEKKLIKKLLTKVTDDFMLELEAPDKDKLDEILGSTTVDSFDVWIGKGDNNIYQYSIVLNAPLSKILSFDDKSIGDNQVKLSWKTTYYDFNIPNDISMPEISTPMTDFVRSIKETKLKNDVSSFKQLATNLFNAEGVFGKKPNPTGSCMSPTADSLFSPIGHTKGASTAVGSISELLNKVLKTTNNQGFCYSTPKDWSFTIPISDSYEVDAIPVGGYQSFFCIDSKGATKNLITPPLGVACE